MENNTLTAIKAWITAAVAMLTAFWGCGKYYVHFIKTEKGWKQYIITSEPEFERHFGRKADKKRKLYNGMIQCNYYMYLGDMAKGRKK